VWDLRRSVQFKVTGFIIDGNWFVYSKYFTMPPQGGYTSVTGFNLFLDCAVMGHYPKEWYYCDNGGTVVPRVLLSRQASSAVTVKIVKSVGCHVPDVIQLLVQSKSHMFRAKAPLQKQEQFVRRFHVHTSTKDFDSRNTIEQGSSLPY
jgi:hypothetical protein